MNIQHLLALVHFSRHLHSVQNEWCLHCISGYYHWGTADRRLWYNVHYPCLDVISLDVGRLNSAVSGVNSQVQDATSGTDRAVVTHVMPAMLAAVLASSSLNATRSMSTATSAPSPFATVSLPPSSAVWTPRGHHQQCLQLSHIAATEHHLQLSSPLRDLLQRG